MADVAGPPALHRWTDPPSSPPHTNEPHIGGLSARLNWLRAGVLGANDGIVSTAGLVVGVTARASSLVTFGIGQLVGAVGI
jgi:hypothetical protein